MATIKSWAQEVIICDLCEKAALRFCNNCQVNLCVDCVSKHVHEHDSMSHNIVPFKDRTMRVVFTECELHPGQRCEVHCQQCNTPVCVFCCIGQHKGHDAIELVKVAENKKEEIRKEVEEIETTLLPEYHTAENDTKFKIFKLTEEFTKRKLEIKHLRKVWHREVDIIFDKADDVINSLQDISRDSLSKHQNQIKAKITEMEQTVKEQKQILKSNKVSEIESFVSKLKDYQEIPKGIEEEILVPPLITNSNKNGELQMEIETFRATLSHGSLLSSLSDAPLTLPEDSSSKSKVVATISSYHNSLWRMACVDSDEVWISGVNELIRLVDLQGTVKDTVVITDDDCPNDIAVSRQRELMYSGGTSRTVKVVRQGKVKTLITTPQCWRPGGLCCGRSGDILVNLGNGKRNKIFRYEGRKVTQTIDKDEDGKNIFQQGGYDLFITENNNEDICVSDLNADTVVVLDMTGKIRFQYDGTPARKTESFLPRCIGADFLGQIIVADCNNDCLHILNQDGIFLRCVDNIGISIPIGLGVDSEGRLWVGSSETGEIKVIQSLN